MGSWRSLQVACTIGFFDSRIVPRSDFVVAAVDPGCELAELDVPVADNVRAGSTSGSEFGHGVRHHPVQVFGLQRDDTERYPGPFADGTRVLEVFLPRAVAQEGKLVFQPDLEIEGGDFVAPFAA